MGNYSKDPQQQLKDALSRGYFRVRFQQGKPALDREFNLAADLANPQRLADVYLGDGVPAGGNGFQIANLNAATGDFTITAGRCLVNGLEAVLAADSSYRAQPVQTNVKPLPAGTSNVYLHVFTREVNGAEDGLLKNPDDVKFETSVRDKIEWEAVVSAAAINRADHFLLATIRTSPLPAVIQDLRRRELTLAAARDELTTARGSAANLNARLGVSLAADGTLLAGAVGNSQLAAASVSQDKMRPGVVALAQIKQAPKFTGTAIVPAGGDTNLIFFTGARHAQMLVSVMVTSGAGTVTWREFFAAVAPVARRGILIHNENPAGGASLTVQVEAIEIQAI